MVLACGDGATIAEVLGTPADFINEVDHHRVAALVCLGIGAQLTGEALDGSFVIAIGDSHGVYVLPDRCHADCAQL